LGKKRKLRLWFDYNLKLAEDSLEVDEFKKTFCLRTWKHLISFSFELEMFDERHQDQQYFGN